MPQLDPTWFASQLFWLVIAFVALYVVLSRFVLPPLQSVMAQRQQTVEGDIERAQSLKSQAEAARTDYERTLAEARDKAQSLMDQAMAAHKQRAEKAGKEMDRQLETKLTDATRRITARKEELLSELTPAATELASMIVEKLTHTAPGKEQVTRAVGDVAKGRR